MPEKSPAPSNATRRLAWNRIHALDQIRGERFEWAHAAREMFLKDWERSRKRYQEWRLETTEDIARLEAQDCKEDADWLAAELLAHPMVSDPGNFEVTIPTGYGHEVFKIIGSADLGLTRAGGDNNAGKSIQPSPSSGSNSKTSDNQQSPQQPPVQVAGAGNRAQMSEWLQKLARPVPLTDDATCKVWKGDSVSVGWVLRHKVWVTRTTSGRLFCINCPCERMIAPAMSTNQAGATHELLQRRFHTDPLAQHSAVQHFMDAHNIEIHNGAEGLIQMFGKQGERAPMILVSKLSLTLRSHAW